MHIESSMLSPGVIAREFIKLGTTSAIADPHEIGNVMGIDGINYLIEETSDKSTTDFFFMFPSCVPATSFETSEVILTSNELKLLIGSERVIGLGEVMNFQGVINCETDLLKKILITKGKGKQVDGHGPFLTNEKLNAYIIAGIKSDHECSTPEEMLEKLSKGMHILIREGTAAKNLEKLVPVIDEYNYRFCMFCTDDRDAETLLNSGQINSVVKKAISLGISPERAVIMGTINPVQFYNLKTKGALAPGYDADFLVIDNIKNININRVFKGGKEVDISQKNHLRGKELGNSVNIKNFKKENLLIPIKKDRVNVISIIPKELITMWKIRKINNPKGYFDGKINKGFSQISVIERHKNTGRVGNGIIENYGIENGAIATTVAHDSHNIIVVGDNSEDMYLAVKELEKTGGGVVLVKNGELIGVLELKIAGLMSDKDIYKVKDENENIVRKAWDELKVNREIEPLMTLNFMALPVIPEIKVTDKGLFLVSENKFIPIEAEI